MAPMKRKFTLPTKLLLKNAMFKRPRKENVKQACGWKVRYSQEYSVSVGEKQGKIERVEAMSRYRDFLEIAIVVKL